MLTRFAVLPDDRKILIGIDKANVFEPGMVYEAMDILDTIVIKKLGSYSLSNKGGPVSENSDVNTQVYYGYHLLTQEEYEQLCNSSRQKNPE